MPAKVKKTIKGTKTYRTNKKVKKGGKGGKYTWYGNDSYLGYDVYDHYDYSEDEQEEDIYADVATLDTYLAPFGFEGRVGPPPQNLFVESKPTLKRQVSDPASKAITLAPSILQRIPSYDGEFDSLLVSPPTSLLGTPQAFWDEQEKENDLIEKLKAVQILPLDNLKARSSLAKKTSDASAKCMKRVFRELRRDLPRALDNDAFGSIFIRYDSESPQFMQALLTGGPFSPYCHGLFLFDIACGKDYPAQNCDVVHITKDSNSFKLMHSPGGFSPNLHSSTGKVCLSLLGTWNGIGWSPNKSNIYQVLSTLIRDVFGVEYPYYNEPNHGFWEGTAPKTNHRDVVIECNEILREKTIELAMLAPLKKPPTGFESAVKLHFLVRQTAIEKSIKKWVEEARSRVAETKRQYDIVLKKDNAKNEPKSKKQSKKKKKKTNHEVTTLKRRYTRQKSHVAKLSNLAQQLREALIENMEHGHLEVALKRKMNCMHYANRSLEMLSSKLGAMFNTYVAATKPIQVERGGITFKAERKVTSTFRSAANKDLQWERQHSKSKSSFDKALNQIKATKLQLQSQKAVRGCLQHLVSLVLHNASIDVSQKVETKSETSDNKSPVTEKKMGEDVIDLSSVEMDDEDTEKFGAAPAFKKF